MAETNPTKLALAATAEGSAVGFTIPPYRKE